MSQPADLRHRLEQAEEARIGDDYARDRTIHVRKQPLEGGQVGRAGVRTGGHERDLVGDERGSSEVGAERLAVVGVDSPADEHSLAPGCAAGHQRTLSRCRCPVVMRSGYDVEAGQLGHQRLVFVDALERALADLRLVGRIGGVELAPQQQLVDYGRSEVAIGSGAEEADQIDAVEVGKGG